MRICPSPGARDRLELTHWRLMGIPVSGGLRREVEQIRDHPGHARSRAVLHVEERGDRSGGRARGRQRPVGEDERVERLPEIVCVSMPMKCSRRHALDPQAGVGFAGTAWAWVALLAHQGSDPGLELDPGQRACERSRWRPPRKPPRDPRRPWRSKMRIGRLPRSGVSRMKRQRSRPEPSRHVPVDNEQVRTSPVPSASSMVAPSVKTSTSAGASASSRVSSSSSRLVARCRRQARQREAAFSGLPSAAIDCIAVVYTPPCEGASDSSVGHSLPRKRPGKRVIGGAKFSESCTT